MIRKYVEEAIKQRGLTSKNIINMLIDYVETLIADGRLIDKDVEAYFNEALDEEDKNVRRLDADTKELVKFLFDKGIFVKRPVQPVFKVEDGIECAIFDLEESRVIPRVVKVRRSMFNNQFVFGLENKKFHN